MEDETAAPVVQDASPPFDPAAKKAYLAALAKAQGAFPTIARNRTVSIKPRDGAAYSFKYAELAEVLGAVRPALAENGLSIRSRVVPAAPGFIWLQSIVAHAEGYEDISEVQIQIAGDLKLFGGQLTYLRRYMAGCQLGVASEDDDDENGKTAGEGTGNVATGERAAPVPPPKPRPQQVAELPRGDEPTPLVSPALAQWLNNAIAAQRESGATDEDIGRMFEQAGSISGLAVEKLPVPAGQKLRELLRAR